jgi:hypothetical protein
MPYKMNLKGSDSGVYHLELINFRMMDNILKSSVSERSQKTIEPIEYNLNYF